MQTAAVLQKENQETTIAAEGKATSNPLQQTAVEPKKEAWQRLQKKTNSFLPQKNSSNPLQPGQAVQQAAPPVQLISDYSHTVLQKIFIPLLELVLQKIPYLPEGFEQEINTVRSAMDIDDRDQPTWQTAAVVIRNFINTVFSKYRLTLAVDILDRLNASVDDMGGESAKSLTSVIKEVRDQKHHVTVQEGYVDIDPRMVDPSTVPRPQLKGLVWNLHGFSNVRSGEDKVDFKLKGKGGEKQTHRRLYVNAIINKIAERSEEAGRNLQHFEKGVEKAIQEENSDRLESQASLPLNRKLIDEIYNFVILQDKKFQRDFAIQVGDTDTYQIKANKKQEVLTALKNYQSELEDESPEYKKIDKLLGRIESAELLNKFRRKPHYISNLLDTIGHLPIPKNPSEKFLLRLIGLVKELRDAIKLLNAFQSDEDKEGKIPLHNAFDNLSQRLHEGINRNTTREHATDDQNLAVYLDKELNKYAIVAYLTSALNDNRLNLDFMLLNEMNRGINSFTTEVRSGTHKKYEVASGPQMAAIKQDGAPSQREYYPLVYNTEKFRLPGQPAFYVGVKNEKLTIGEASGEELKWRKPENKKGNEDFLDYRPIIVHRLVPKEVQDESEKNQIWLAAVHTTPYGTEFERKKIYRQLEDPLKYLQKKANESGATLIIGGDFYIAAEALSIKPPKAPLYRLSTEKDADPSKIYESNGDKNEDRNLRDPKGNIYNFTKLLSGDSDPRDGRKNTMVGIGLQDVRSVTGTNKNSKGLQSADYFVVPATDKDRVRAGLIDPLTRNIVELETDDQQISRHNFNFSDHLISAIELYATKTEKEKARLYGRMENNMSARMYQQQILKLGNKPESNKYEIGDFEPQPGLANIITTLLFQIWEILYTTETQSKSPDYKDLLNWIDKTRHDLKKQIAYDPRLHKQDLVSLLAALKKTQHKTIDEYADIISSLIDNYIKKDSSHSDRLKRTELLSKKKPRKNLNYPDFLNLPSLLKEEFKENLQVGRKLKAENNAEAIKELLAGKNKEQLNQFIEAMFSSPTDIDDPKIIDLMNKTGISVSFYTVAFFEERDLGDRQYYMNILKDHYGKGDTYALKILYVSSGLLQPACSYSGYYLLDKS
ncbi:hypothetical protein [Niastella populi]|uniref:Uncharacterized protein n=1 Tax=Niastella populi TaxID=550983 RepID=A0A1V9EPI5_9BACT|nr:hypothetical protein [Niastella populi]OQP47991.1 hypothetical protein A4R26_31380 [Niastella populi]